MTPLSACIFRFPSELEAAFLHEQRERGVLAVRATAVVALLIVLIFSIWPLGGRASYEALGIYLGIIAPGLLLLIAATFQKALRQQLHWISSAVLLAGFGFGSARFMSAFPDKIVNFQPASAILVTTIFYVAMRLPLMFACAAGFLYSSSILALSAHYKIFSPDAFSAAALHLLAANVLGAYAAYSLEAGRRFDFLSRLEVEKERQRSERLLLNILPPSVAKRLKEGEETIADEFAQVSVLFADIVGYTALSGRMKAVELVALLNDIFSRFDALLEESGIEKIKTIGDAYMAVSGLPGSRGEPADAAARLGLGMLSQLEEVNRRRNVSLALRVGISSGPALAGVIGSKKFSYDLWGNTVNVASRMESSGLPGRIHVCAAAAEKLSSRYELEPRGLIDVRGKGPMETFFIGAAKSAS